MVGPSGTSEWRDGACVAPGDRCFFAIFIRRGTHLLAPLAYVASCAANGIGFSALLIDIEKRGAPGPRLTIADGLAEAVVCLAPALLVTAAALLWNYRAASKAKLL